VFDISPIQIVIVLAIALLIFGPKRLPEMGRNLGKGIRDFKGGITGEEPTPVHHVQAPVAAAPVAPTAEQIITEVATPAAARVEAAPAVEVEALTGPRAAA
jgi:sec-independent protein translocase protein TatA